MADERAYRKMSAILSADVKTQIPFPRILVKRHGILATSWYH